MASVKLDLITALKAKAGLLDFGRFVEYTTRDEVGTPIKLRSWQRDYLVPILANILKLRRGKAESLLGKLGKTLKGIRIRFHAPPQYGKSIILSKRFPLWILLLDPLHRIIIATYNDAHTAQFFDALNNPPPEFRQLYPDFKLTGSFEKGLFTKERTALGDGTPSIFFCSISTGFTGLGADTIIIDDPYKNYEDAVSAAYRQKVIRFFEFGLNSRITEATNVIVMYHAWAKGDLGDYVVSKFGYTPYRFPAIADENKKGDDPTGREPGELLEGNHTVAALLELKEVMPDMFAGMFQGLPNEDTELMFQPEYFEGMFIKPSQVPPLGKWWRGLDTAIGVLQVNDKSATCKLAYDSEKNLYIRACKTERVAPAGICDWFMAIIKDELNVNFVVEQHNAGYAVIEFFSRLPIFKHLVKVQEITGIQGGKRKRAVLLATLAKQKKVFIVMEGEWQELYNQFLGFTGYIPGEVDDLIDAITVVLTFIKESKSKTEMPKAVTPEGREAQALIEEMERRIA